YSWQHLAHLGSGTVTVAEASGHSFSPSQEQDQRWNSMSLSGTARLSTALERRHVERMSVFPVTGYPQSVISPGQRPPAISMHRAGSCRPALSLSTSTPKLSWQIQAPQGDTGACCKA